jgi:hypothetical protein
MSTPERSKDNKRKKKKEEVSKGRYYQALEALLSRV